MKLKIKKGDTVEVTAGSSKGTKGPVLEVDPKKLRVRVQGANVQTHFSKKDGIQKIEGFFDYSNVKLVAAAKVEKKNPAKTKSAK
jgi:large subunit ribosomal protein L24